MIFKNYIIKNLFFVLCLTVLLGLSAYYALKWHTHHGEELVLPDYVDKPLSHSLADAEENSFRIEVTDSIFLVDKTGGLIIQQNPTPGSKVKRNRKIYVTITKSNADMIAVENLPRLYGERYDIKKNELAKGFEIRSKVVDKVYDAGLPDMIMEVRYGGETIIDAKGRKGQFEVPKGGLLEFVLSTKSGGRVQIPNLRCLTYDEASALLSLTNLNLGESITDGSLIQDRSYAFVTDQVPGYMENETISIGDTVHLIISDRKPEDCR